MLVLGIILIVLAALALAAALTGGSSDPAILDLGVLEIETTVLGIFLAGAGTLLVFVFGLELVRSGTRKNLKIRKERKRLRRLEKREAEQGAPAPDAGTAGTTGTTSTTGTTTDPAADPAHPSDTQSRP